LRKVQLTESQSDALTSALKFYGSIGMLLHSMEKRVAPMQGRFAPLNDLSIKVVASAYFGGYTIRPEPRARGHPEC